MSDLPGFNPCSFGCQSESGEREWVYPSCQGVSILVLLDVSLKAAGGRLDHLDAARVSILVLLDVSLKGWWSQT